jgi:predicted aldo/keto reductase-like oxidoreductase
MSTLTETAQKAVAEFSDSDIELAIAFVEKALPEFVGTSNDRLLKVGRSVKSLVEMVDDLPLESSLELLVEECRLLTSGQVKVPKVKFGKTELEISVVTLGCMRFQQEWGPRITNMNQIGSDCQDNLVAILKQAIDYGINHIETARGYGCSEIQLGAALKQLFMTNQVKREDLIIQTKIRPMASADEFRKTLELSLKNLQVSYVDLCAFHGMHGDEELGWAFDGEDNCHAVLEEFKKAGKIRHMGFSTHASTDFILKCIKKNVFDYVNLHYHYFGSYTASGGGHDGNGNLNCVKLMEEKGMGIFIISPYDKGGRLYAPSRKLRSMTLPEFEPMEFGSQWIWNHHLLEEGEGALPQLHTFTVGAARPSDLDQPAVAAYLHASKPDETLAKVKTVVERLEAAKVKVLGKEWVETWAKGLPKAAESKYTIEHNQLVWMYNSIKVFGMYEFAKARYGSFEGNGKKWDDKKTMEENINAVGKSGWGFVPGLPLRPGTDYSDDLTNVPAENLERVKEAEAFVYKWCASKAEKEGKEDPMAKRVAAVRKNFAVSTQIFSNLMKKKVDGEEKKESESDATVESTEEKVPTEWETAYDMRCWPDFPDRVPRLG